MTGEEVNLARVDSVPAREWEKGMLEIGAQVAEAYTADFRGESYRALLTREDLTPPGNQANVRGLEAGGEDWRWHVSVSRLEAGEPTEAGIPGWMALAAIVHAIRPGVTFVVGIPPASLWLNVHPGVLHAMETKDGNLEGRWRMEGQARILRKEPA